jgi:hypothetical protein
VATNLLVLASVTTEPPDLADADYTTMDLTVNRVMPAAAITTLAPAGSSRPSRPDGA